MVAYQHKDKFFLLRYSTYLCSKCRILGRERKRLFVSRTRHKAIFLSVFPHERHKRPEVFHLLSLSSTFIASTKQEAKDGKQRRPRGKRYSYTHAVKNSTTCDIITSDTSISSFIDWFFLDHIQYSHGHQTNSAQKDHVCVECL